MTALLIAVGGGAAWYQFGGGRAPERTIVEKKEKVERGVSRIGWLTIVQEDLPPETIAEIKPSELPRYLDAIYRLKPDRRFLYAVAEIDRILTGRSDRKISLRFVSGSWRVRFGDEDVGQLPEIPSYLQMKALLASWADREAPKNPAVEKPLASSDLALVRSDLEKSPAPIVVAALARLNALWKTSPGSPELLEMACSGLVWLRLQGFDELEQMDPLEGKALALLALGERVRPESFRRHEVLLAEVLGYETAAKDLAATLPADDPVRLFVRRETEALRVVAEKSHQPREQYFYLLRLAEKKDDEKWIAWLKDSVWAEERGVPTLAAGLRLDSFGMAPQFSAALGAEVLREIASSHFPDPGPLSDRGEAPEGRLAELEKTLKKRASDLQGSLLDRESIEAFYRGNLYGAIHQRAHHLFDGLGSTPAADEYAASILNPPSGTAAELKRWMLDRVALRNAVVGSTSVVADDLSTLKEIGVVPLKRIRHAVVKYVRSTADPDLRRPVRGYFERLDTRPRHLIAAGEAAYDNLVDLRLMEKYFTPGVVAAPFAADKSLGWCARLAGDADWLRRIINDETLGPGAAAWALSELKSLSPGDKQFLESQYQKLLTANPEDSESVIACLEVMSSRGDVHAADALVREWTRLRGGKPDLKWAAVEVAHSALLRKAGKLDEAWRVIEPAAETWKASCLAEAARVLYEQRKYDEALVYAERLRERYPEGGFSYFVTAEILWRQKKPEEVAEFFRAHKVRLVARAWDEDLADSFSRAFPSSGTADEAERAFGLLLPLGLGVTQLEGVPRLAAERGDHDLAFRLAARIASAPASKIAAYEYLLKAKGREAASKWIRDQLPGADHEVAILAFQSRDYDLLWELFPEPVRSPKAGVIHLMRAAALAHMRLPNDPRKAASVVWVKSRPPSDFLALWAGYLLGVVDKETILATSGSGAELASVGWVLGLRAASERRYEEANDWYQVAFEGGGPREPPRTYAIETLVFWTRSRSFLPAVAAKGIL